MRTFPLQRAARRTLGCASAESIPGANDVISSPNIKLEKIPNMRDLSTATTIKIKNNYMYRTGCVSKATENDVRFFYCVHDCNG